LWPTITVKAIFDADTDPVALRGELSRQLPPSLPPPHFETLPDKAWEREWLKDFRPMRFGRRLWVCPGGLPAGDPDGIRIELDPASPSHGNAPNHRTVPEWLESAALDGCSVVDYGCGSGILAITAAVLGAAEVRAVDIDRRR